MVFKGRKERVMIRKLIYKMRKRRFCKLNRWSCPDCVYHDFVFEGAIFRGNRCRYPKHRERTDRPKGKWLEVDSFESGTHSVTDMRCSLCGKYASIVLPHGNRYVYDFCPNCGADMRTTDGEKSEEHI